MASGEVTSGVITEAEGDVSDEVLFANDNDFEKHCEEVTCAANDEEKSTAFQNLVEQQKFRIPTIIMQFDFLIIMMVTEEFLSACYKVWYIMMFAPFVPAGDVDICEASKDTHCFDGPEEVFFECVERH